jgi:hypothetical protein
MEVNLNGIKYKCLYHFGVNDSFIEKANTQLQHVDFLNVHKFVSITFWVYHKIIFIFH